MHRALLVCAAVAVACCAAPPGAHAGPIDVTVFLGRAYPVYDERLTIRPSVPSFPGVDVTVSGDPVIRTDGGLVVAAALAFELGILAIEGRLDGVEIGFDLSGARYDLRATQGPVAGLTGSVTLGDGRFDADRFYILSGNVRLRTPGSLGIVMSGGVSLLPDVTITGSVPVAVQIAGLPTLPGVEPRLRLLATPGQSEYRFGINGGAGLRLGGGPFGVIAEVRAFYFRDYELQFDVEGAPELAAALLENVGAIRFQPVIVNAQAGLVFRF